MYRIIDKKGAGKTSRLMLLAKEVQGIIVCSNPLKLREKAHCYGITGLDFISYEDYLNGGFESKPIFIDELDKFLKFYDNHIAGYTISNED